MYYIRFTEDIYEDLERGHSFHFRDNSKLEGLCAWGIMEDLSPYASESEVISAAKRTAKMIKKNTYGGYSSDSQFAVLKGNYVGNSNDGVLIEIEKIISIETL